ncbi:hydrophobic surface binding protein [Auriculariales sp. MPI-PUGE-AT-0066]|nr:hydrophobic surface binding protein [Auriculariales sp. MPI-PUGE-AT-0066]
MYFTRSFVAVLALSSSVLGAFIERRTAATILTDIADVQNKTSALDALVVAYPTSGGTLAGALAIHTAATTVDTAVKKLTTDTTATPSLTEAEGQSILTAFQNFDPIIVKTLNDVVAKKAAFAALPIGGIPALVKSDLNTLNTDTQAAESAILAITPADLVAAANVVIAHINAAFASAIAAYA